MKNILLTFITSIGIIASLSGQGIEFFHGTWEEALLKARNEDRIIFIDAYTTWCGPCKNMAANTFPNPEVGEYFNANFISMKIDMEKEMGLEFRKKFPVSAYPTLFFIDYDEEVVLKSVGAKGPADLIAIAQSVVSKYDKSYKYEDAYNAGDRSYQLVYDYVVALNKAGKPSVKIVNDYLGEQADLTTPENLKFILEGASQVDCNCFELLEKYKSQIAKISSEDAIKEKVRFACSNTVKRAIEFESHDLITLAAEAMKRHIPSEADFFASKSEIQYALALHDLGQMESLVNHHVKKFVRNDADGLHQLALDLHKYAPDDVGCRTLAIDLASKSAKDDDPKHVATYAELVNHAGQKEEAIRILEEAIRKYSADDESKDLKHLKALKNKITNG
jgi:thiol-disulfide isomerase/thioredoxin